jgi:hypothetical protein
MTDTYWARKQEDSAKYFELLCGKDGAYQKLETLEKKNPEDKTEEDEYFEFWMQHFLLGNFQPPGALKDLQKQSEPLVLVRTWEEAFLQIGIYACRAKLLSKTEESRFIEQFWVLMEPKLKIKGLKAEGLTVRELKNLERDVFMSIPDTKKMAKAVMRRFATITTYLTQKPISRIT